MNEQKSGDAQGENEKRRVVVINPFGEILISQIGDQQDRGDADGVDQNGERDGHQADDDFFPHRQFGNIGVNDRDQHHRHQRADAATTFCDIEPPGTLDGGGDGVAGADGGDGEEFRADVGNFCGDELQSVRCLLQAGNVNGAVEQEDGDEGRPGDAPTEEEEHGTPDNDAERSNGQAGLGEPYSEYEQGDTKDEHGESRPCCGVGHFFEIRPAVDDESDHNDRHQESVFVVGFLVPTVDQPCGSAVVAFGEERQVAIKIGEDGRTNGDKRPICFGRCELMGLAAGAHDVEILRFEGQSARRK